MLDHDGILACSLPSIAPFQGYSSLLDHGGILACSLPSTAPFQDFISLLDHRPDISFGRQRIPRLRSD
jgi:hypothetical protein